jgi:hypothetical protein
MTHYIYNKYKFQEHKRSHTQNCIMLCNDVPKLDLMLYTVHPHNVLLAHHANKHRRKHNLTFNEDLAPSDS